MNVEIRNMPNITFQSRLAIAAVAIAAIGQSLAVHAQEGGNSSRTLEEIVVTATKVEQNLQDVGVTVNAFTEDQINEYSLRNVEDVAAFTPGLSVRATTAGSMPVVSIRGVGVTSELVFSQTPPSAAIHIDEIYYGAPIIALLGNLDTQRIEVLKGPQGTLFGRNTTAGSVNFISNKPDDEFGASADVTSGFFDTEGSYTDVRGHVTGPVSDEMNARFAFSRVSGDDFNRDLNDRPYKGADSLAARAQLDWSPSANVDVLFTLRGAKDESGTKANHAFLVADNGDNTCLFDQRDELTQDLVNCAPTFAVRDTIINDAGEVVPFAELVFPYNNDVHKNGYQDGSPPSNDIEAYGASTRIDWALNGSVNLVSLTAYDEADVLRFDHYISRPTGTDRSYIEIYDESIAQLSQELRLDYSSERMRGLIGLYYFDEDIDHSRLGHFAGEQTLPENWRTDMISKHRTESWAVFVDGDYSFSNAFSMVGGMRFTYEEKAYERLVRYNFQREVAYDVLDPTFIPVRDNPITGATPVRFVRQEVCPCEEDWDDVDWKIGANFRPADDVLLYGLVSNGFKGGLYIGSSLTFPQELSQPAEPENLTMYEIGVKSEVLNNTLRLNASAYYYDYQDMQIQVSLATPEGNTSIVTNAEKTEIQGIDLDMTWVPTDSLTVSVAAAFIDGEYTDFRFVDPFDGDVTDYSGQDVIDTPEISITTRALYDWNIGNYNLTLGGEVIHLGDTDFSFRDGDITLGGLNYAAFQRKPVTVANARLIVGTPANIALSFFVNNVTDEEVVTAIRRSREAVTAQYSAPRTFGVRLVADF